METLVHYWTLKRLLSHGQSVIVDETTVKSLCFLYVLMIKTGVKFKLFTAIMMNFCTDILNFTSFYSWHYILYIYIVYSDLNDYVLMNHCLAFIICRVLLFTLYMFIPCVHVCTYTFTVCTNYFFIQIPPFY